MTMELGESVHRLLEQRGRRMLGTIGYPVLRGILQPEVGRESIILSPAAASSSQQRRADPLRQTRHHDFGPPSDEIGAQLLERRQIDPGQVAIDVGNLASGVVFGGEHAELYERMPGKNAHRLDA